MKKVLLILLCASMSLMLFGFILVAAGGFKMAPNINYSNDKSYPMLAQPQVSEKTVDAKDCGSIELNLVNTKLDVVKYKGSDVKIDYESIYKNEWSYSFDGSKLKLENERYKNVYVALQSFYNFINALKNGKLDLHFDIDVTGNNDGIMHSVKLYIPDGAAPSFNISNVNGGIDLNGVSAKDMSFNIVNSSLNIADSASEDSLKITDVNGEIDLKNVAAPELDIKSIVNGQCTIDAPKFDTINTQSLVNGTLRLTGVPDPEDYAITYSTVNGGVEIGGGSYRGSGNYAGSGSAKYKIVFKGVNSNLYVTN